MRKLEVIVEQQDGRARPMFVPDGRVNMSWVGDWETDDQALVEQVAKAFQDWFVGR